MAIFVTFKTKDTMNSFFILLSLYCFFVVNVVNGKSVTFPSRVEIIMDEDFDLPDGPGNGHRSIPPVTPFLAFLNDDHSIDLEFYQSIGEIEIVISQNGDVVYSSTENIDSPILRKVQLQKGLVGDFLLEIKGLDGAYAFGRFTIH